jgi:hypothetical protein
MTIRRAMNLLGLSFLAAGLVCLVVFHFLPGDEAFEEGRGWRIWLEVWDGLRDPDLQDDPEGMIGLCSFLGLVALVLVSPFFFGVLRRSRLIWWMATLFSGVATMGLWAVVLRANSWEQIGVAGAVLLAAPLCNLVGLMLLRGERGVGEVPSGAAIGEGNP